VFPVWE